MCEQGCNAHVAQKWCSQREKREFLAPFKAIAVATSLVCSIAKPLLPWRCKLQRAGGIRLPHLPPVVSSAASAKSQEQHFAGKIMLGT